MYLGSFRNFVPKNPACFAKNHPRIQNSVNIHDNRDLFPQFQQKAEATVCILNILLTLSGWLIMAEYPYYGTVLKLQELRSGD